MSNVGCYGLAIDDDGLLYIVDYDKHEVRRYQIGENQGTVVAVYVSDYNSHRVMKWTKGEKRGIVVVGGQGQGNSLSQLSNPCGIIVDQSSTLYVADFWNDRIMR
ncbi:unnamed protein product [Rotaria sp. Silwood1]|nr:unnamed protein product [Rotaria sp. Silwood1]